MGQQKLLFSDAFGITKKQNTQELRKLNTAEELIYIAIKFKSI